MSATKMFSIIIVVLISLLFFVDVNAANGGLAALNVSSNAGGGKTYSVTLQVLAMMTLLSLLPALLMTMTSFTRIIIVLAILRQAMGMAQTPTNQILIGISLFLSLFIMSPVFEKVNTTALEPYMSGKLSAEKSLSKAQIPFRDFMLNQTRENDLNLFARLAGKEDYKSESELPFTVLMPAFLTSELKTAFQIGFILFIPFLIIDIVVASVLMAMGMMMLSPLIISLPFKVMLFVLVDGWTLVIGMLAASFGT